MTSSEYSYKNMNQKNQTPKYQREFYNRAKAAKKKQERHINFRYVLMT